MYKITLAFILVLMSPSFAFAKESHPTLLHGISSGMTKADLLKIYPKTSMRCHRQEGTEEWASFNTTLKIPVQNVVTFHFQNGRLKEWKFNDRPEIVEEYLNEFCSLQGFPIIFTAIREVLNRMPYQDFLNVTDRQRPVLFIEYYDSGTARFASSQEFILTKDDAPCCQEGFTIIKLGLGLGLSKTPGPVEGVVAHELAHRVLDHIRKGHVNCEAERQSNALIKKWGFTEEFHEASKLFGQRKGDPAGCQETSSGRT